MEPVMGTRDMTSTGHTIPSNVKFRDRTEYKLITHKIPYFNRIWEI